jgi:hypothetical protein
MKQLLKIICGALFLASTCLPLAAQQGGRVRPARPAGATRGAIKMPPVKASADSSAPLGWKKFQFGEPALFGVILPEKHESIAELVPMAGAGQPATNYMYSGQTESSVYMAGYIENLPFIAERVPETFKQSFYDGMWRGMLQGMKSALERNGVLFDVVSGEKKNITISGLAGRSQDFTFGPLNGHARIVIAGRRAFMAMSMAPPDGGSERELFFKSFEIYTKR